MATVEQVEPTRHTIVRDRLSYRPDHPLISRSLQPDLGEIQRMSDSTCDRRGDTYNPTRQFYQYSVEFEEMETHRPARRGKVS